MTTSRLKPCNTPECRRIRAMLSDFLDHSLHWRTARAMAEHLAVCPPCAGYVVSVEQTILLYRERPVVDVPPAVRGHLREVLREHHEAKPKRGTGRCCAGGVTRGRGKSAAKSVPSRDKTASARAGKTSPRTAKTSGRP